MADTVIVGGGSSGLAAAFTLQRSGMECMVLEARDFAGGRIAGARKEGFILDLGAQFFFTRYRATFELMEALGISGSLVRFTRPIGILRRGKLYMFERDILKLAKRPFHLLAMNPLSAAGTLKAALFLTDLMRKRKLFDFDDAEKALALDPVDLASYSRERFGEEVLEYVVQPVASALTLGEPEGISAAYGLALVWYGAPGLLTTTRGIGYLAERLSSAVKEIRTGVRALKVIVENGKVRGVSFDNGKKTETVDCRKVICATTASEAAQILDGSVHPSVVRALARVEYSSCAHFMFALDEKLMGEAYAVATPRKEGFCFSGITENANKAEGYAPPGKGILHAYTFGKHAREMVRSAGNGAREKVMADIERILPGFREKVLFSETFMWEKAVCLCAPGHIASMSRLKNALGDYRGLYLAGEYLEMPSVEAAVHTGLEAARMVLEDS